MHRITEKDREILVTIERLTVEMGFSPTVRELGKAVGLKSTSSVHARLRKLAESGALSYEPTKPRTLVVLHSMTYQSDICPTKVR